MDNLLNDFFNEVSFGKTDFHQPRHAHKETDEGYEYRLNLAGFKRENIKVNVENETLNIEAKQGEKKLDDSLWIPEDADAKASVAKYEDGILYIKLNKKESSKPLNIEVK
jgi:HSP20 family molecular chaperone IbpA